MARPAPHTVALHGHDLSYVDSGSGPVVLFIHGILGLAAPVVPPRRQDRRRPPGGRARPVRSRRVGQADGRRLAQPPAATLRDLLDHLGVERVTLVGHSLGGGIATQFYYLFPDRVDRLVLVSSGGLGREVNLVLRSATLPGAEQVLSVIASAPVLQRAEALGRGAQKVGWKPGADIGAIWRGFTSLGDRESRRAFLATTRAVIDFGGQSISAHDHLGAVTPPPTLIVWGSKDRMIPAWHALSAQRAVPACRVELFEGAGHFPHLDDPDRFARVLREFMSEA